MVLAGILAIIFEYKVYSLIDPFPSKNRIIFIAIAIMAVFVHFIIKLDKMYNFLYKYRYIVACAFLLFVMVGQYVIVITGVMLGIFIMRNFIDVSPNAYRELFWQITVPYIVLAIVYYVSYFNEVKKANRNLLELKKKVGKESV